MEEGGSHTVIPFTPTDSDAAKNLVLVPVKKFRCDNATRDPKDPIDSVSGDDEENLSSRKRKSTEKNEVDGEDEEEKKKQKKTDDKEDLHATEKTGRIVWKIEYLDAILYILIRCKKLIYMTLSDLLSILFKPTIKLITVVIDFCSRDFVPQQQNWFVALEKEEIEKNSIQKFFECEDAKMAVYISSKWTVIIEN